LDGHFDSRALDLHTCLPGKVLAYYSSDYTVDVQPMLKKRYASDDQVIEVRPINKVPLVFPSMGSAHVRLPVAKGDEVLLVFSERSIDDWYESGSVEETQSKRHHDMTDAFAIPGGRSKVNKISSKGADTSLEICNGSAWIEITAAGKIILKNSAVELLDIIDQLIIALQGATTMTAIGPQPLGPGAQIQLTRIKILLSLMKG